MKREESLPNDIDNIYLNFVSVFPRENNKEYDGNHLLYSGDKNGVLRIYEIEETENPKFQLKSKLQTNGEAILSAMIFFDKFGELSKDEDKIFRPEKLKTEEFWGFCYILITTNDKSIFLYRYTNKKWLLHSRITNPFNEKCLTINYFHDEKLNETRFFFGFSSYCIAKYDIKDNSLGKTEFITRNGVSSISFVFKKQENQDTESFLIYTQRDCNSLIIGNVNTGKIARKVDLPNVKQIYDCCVWNGSSEKNGENASNSKIYLILSCEGEIHSIRILDFDGLGILYVKEMVERPVNSVKVLMRVNDHAEYNEGLVSLMRVEKTGKILLYKNKKA